MNATEAKKKADERQQVLQTQRDKRVAAILQEIYKIIAQAAQRGAYKETYTFDTLVDESEVRDGVIGSLRKDGYKVTIGDGMRQVDRMASSFQSNRLTINITWI